MLRVYNLNCPATPTTLAVSTVSITATTHFFHQDGRIIGPTGALTFTPTADMTVDAGKTAFFALYERATYTTIGTTVLSNRIEKLSEQDTDLTTTVYNQDFAGGVASATTKSVPVPALFLPWAAYLAGGLVRFGLEIYSAKANFTAGASFNSDNRTLVTTPDATPRAIVGFVMVTNGSASQFIGGTTSFAAANITTTLISEVAYNFQ